MNRFRIKQGDAKGETNRLDWKAEIRQLLNALLARSLASGLYDSVTHGSDRC